MYRMIALHVSYFSQCEASVGIFRVLFSIETGSDEVFALANSQYDKESKAGVCNLESSGCPA